MTHPQKVWLLLGLCTAAVMGVFVYWNQPYPQDPGYHHFADRCGWLNIPNFGNVMSNIFFIPAGLYGFWVLRERKGEAAYTPLLVFLLGVALVALGSAYYHWTPNNLTLVWDRLPMTVGFMGLTAAVIADRIDPKVGVRYALPLLIIIGVASVVYWHLTDDLRPYGLVQFLPMGLIPLMIVLFKSDTAMVHWRAFISVLIFYGLAKVCEHYDVEIYNALGTAVSGHTLKHMFAAVAPVALVTNLARK